MSDTCKRCGGTGKEPACEPPAPAPPAVQHRFKHYDSFAEMRAMLLVPKPVVRLTCVRCDGERDMTISFVEPPANPSLDAVSQLGSIIDGNRIVVGLSCSVCGPYPATRVAELQPLFELHNLWGADAIPEVLMGLVSEIRANAAATKGAA